MSLKQQLYQTIKDNGYLSYGDMVQMCLEEGFKPSTAERRMRELTHGESKIKPVMGKSKKGTPYIKAYKWEEPVKIQIKEQARLI